ncbi:hypothetical protein MCHIJ_18650 [Mycolicibacterium chitae]|uniref:Uncharacterized protein n=1 Tax=Mycolicibacterium chitae TaxID=1792 RepID=A0A3S4RNL1_MYCCI|nr:hypothetical protein [Mycolicibacterium chitae]MCV7107256.1 hypothetical protein [Mycolicibacterium chitae]BBZ02428.1 hypothetical protein MCHIJ_18650 [Mycolicibacterium chitae]VEG44980.1 Uncharacterised protein [Mycolicibacterium chitae]
MSNLRVFVEAADDWTELTNSGDPAVRLQARDLQHAQRSTGRLRADTGAAVVLDLTVLIAEDRRSARRLLATAKPAGDAVHYVGTVEGLAGLVDDIYTLGVADGVTLIPAAEQQDVRALGEQTLRRLQIQRQRGARRA